MHAENMMKYGHSFLEQALDGLDPRHYKTGGVCGVWSVKDIIAHLGANEGLLVEVLEDVLGIEGESPLMGSIAEHGPAAWNDVQAAERADKSFDEVMAEYNGYRARVDELLPQVSLEKRRQAGLLEWYGDEYDLEDFLVYVFYAHKREHGAEINVLKTRVSS